MYRIKEEDGAIDGLFSEGVPGPTGHPPTRLPALWLNNVQEELATYVESMGIDLDGSNLQQIQQSITRHIQMMSPYTLIVATGDDLAKVSELPNRSSVLVTQDVEITEPITIEQNFLSISFRWGSRLQATSQLDYIFEVKGNGFSLEGLHTEGFNHFVQFSTENTPSFAFIRNSTLKGGTAATTGGTPQFLDLSTVLMIGEIP